jgi:hypothetical protein
MMVSCLQAFLLITFLFHTSLTFSFDLSSFLTNDSWASLMSQYLGPNQATSVFSDILKSFSNGNPEVIINGVNKSMNKLQDLGIVSGYTSTENFINLGVLNVSALNSTLNGKLSPTVLNHVINKLNSSSYITGVQAAGSNYNLGTVNLANFTKLPGSTPVPPTLSYLPFGPTNFIAKLPPGFQALPFLGPLKNVSNTNPNMTKEEKLEVIF